MPKVQFLGRVLPEIIRISIPPRDIGWDEPELNLRTTFKMRINLSLVNVECEIQTNSPDEIAMLLIRAQDMVRAAVNLFAFAKGVGLSVIFDTCIKDDGIPSPIVPQDDVLGSNCTAFRETDNATIDSLFRLVATEELFHRALNDLIMAISSPHVSPQSCARAMDGLKNHIAPPGSKEPVAWQKMRDVLNIDEGYLKYITEVSKGPRHAKAGYTSGTITTEVVNRSWVIMNRYFEYRKRDNQPLRSPDFPLLTA